ncbi:hypothetical protein NDU88_005388 [Pleurodeles waltl]|uniref:Secreted protein n=1 Tax=Pleurodeles waltl TaxID=8319 RepID=A0AAV7X0I8_PLEWA|nr:hypothetical protein NDU88_005388 [Pleurodeles waltl]
MEAVVIILVPLGRVAFCTLTKGLSNIGRGLQGERPSDRRRGLTGLLGDVVLSRRSQPCTQPRPSLELSVGFAQAALTPQRDPRSGLSRSRGESKGKPAANSKSDGIPGEWRSEVVFQAASDKRRGSTGLLGDVVLSPTLTAPALAQSLTETVRRFCTHAAAGPAKQRRAQRQTSSKQQVRRYPTVSPG